MKAGYYSTSEIARLAGVHPNTVRLYEAWGFLPPVERGKNGYRRYTERHLDLMRLSRTALHGKWPGAIIRESALHLVRLAAAGEFDKALEQAKKHLSLVRAEREQAEAAAAILENWAAQTGRLAGAASAAGHKRIGPAAAELGLTIDILRNWERNGLLKVPREPKSGYRVFGPAELNRARVIRFLVQAGYSLMAVLRMLRQLDAGHLENLRETLDTPRPDEDALTAFDRWLSELSSQEERAHRLIQALEIISAKTYP